MTINTLLFRFGHHESARGVTDPGVGSGALLDAFSGFRITVQIATTKQRRWLGFHSFGHDIKLKNLWHDRFQLPAATIHSGIPTTFCDRSKRLIADSALNRRLSVQHDMATAGALIPALLLVCLSFFY
jgi:hypothetical protein